MINGLDRIVDLALIEEWEMLLHIMVQKGEA
jgi:hypothetical protein